MYDTDSRKFLSALCHGASFLSSLLLPITVPVFILFVSKDPVVKGNAKEAINFYFNVWLYGALVTASIFLTFGLLMPLAGLWFIIHYGLTIWALFNVLSNPDKPFRYPFIFRLL